jgi:hypothetical protein
VVVRKCPDGKNAVASDVDVCYPAGFSPNYTYDLVYVARDPVVMGIGFASTRDLVSFLRHERSAANPLMRGGATEPVRWAIGFGRSQSGRYIKDSSTRDSTSTRTSASYSKECMPLISGRG